MTVHRTVSSSAVFQHATRKSIEVWRRWESSHSVTAGPALIPGDQNAKSGEAAENSIFGFERNEQNNEVIKLSTVAEYEKRRDFYLQSDAIWI